MALAVQPRGALLGPREQPAAESPATDCRRDRAVDADPVDVTNLGGPEEPGECDELALPGERGEAVVLEIDRPVLELITDVDLREVVACAVDRFDGCIGPGKRGRVRGR
jgi:hypothetical protein